jgi:hypothetical protein
MYKATAKPKDNQQAIAGIGSPATGATKPAGASGAPSTPAKHPVLGSRQPAVPPLKLGDGSRQPVITSPDAQPPTAPPDSPVKSPSPRKAIRSISEKMSAVSTRVEAAISPRANAAKILDGVEWFDVSTRMPTVSSPSPESSPSRKRKATDNEEPTSGKRTSEDNHGQRNAKRVRFNIEPDRERAEASTPNGRPGYTKQIDLSAHASGKSTAPPPRPTTPVPTELTPIKLPPDLKFGIPTLRQGPPANPVGSSANNNRKIELAMPLVLPAIAVPPNNTASSDIQPNLDVPLKTGLAEPAQRLQEASDSHETPDNFPFAPDKLGKWAIKQREMGNAWIGKASGKSLAATLQRTLDGLQANNVGRIDTEACGYLQELFGLLPAGTEKANKAFNYMLMKSFYSLGLTDAQWNTVEQLYKDFDKLDTRHDPDGCAVFKAQLGEIVGAKNGLVFAKQLTEKQASGSINS